MKPREWWIYRPDDDYNDVYNEPQPELSEVVHVIEYPAYEALKAEVIGLKEINGIQKTYLEAAKNYEEQIQGKLQRIEEAMRDVIRTMEKEAPLALAEKVKEVYSLKDELRFYKEEVKRLKQIYDSK